MKQSNTQTAACYCRVAHEDGEAMDRQRKSLIQFAIDKGYNPVCYADNGASGLTFQRPAFAELEMAIAKGEVKTLIVKDLSRIGRNTYEVMRWLDDCEQAGVTVISIQDGFCPSATTQMQSWLTSSPRGGGRV